MPQDLRDIVQRRLNELGHSTYWLARHEDLVAGKPDSIYRWFRGETEPKLAVVMNVLEILDLLVVHENDVDPKAVRRERRRARRVSSSSSD